MTVQLAIIATGKYRSFLAELIESANRFFLPAYGDVKYTIISDCRFTPTIAGTRKQTRFLQVSHLPWPLGTLLRYEWLSQINDGRPGDYLFYIDADSRFVAPVRDEILGDLMAVRHGGYYLAGPDEELPFERRPASTACITPQMKTPYYIGAFQGGSVEAYGRAVLVMRNAIRADLKTGITAKWWDESHWNRYLLDHPPTVDLLPSYMHLGASSRVAAGNIANAMIVAIAKDHEVVRQ